MKKICCRCKEEKDLKDFNKQKRTKDGYRYECKECQRVYYKNNREKELKRCAKYRLNNREKLSKYRLNNRERYLINLYKKNDKDKNRENDLTVEWFKENITNKPCLYCGNTKRIGADRIDNTKGHTKDNVVPCCLLCNQTRSNNFTLEEMIRIGKVIREIKNDRLRKDNKS